MRADIVFNDEVIEDKFLRGHGFSCLLNGKVLFDTGGSCDTLFTNMGLMDIEIADIESVVISHEHDDHTGGLWGLLEKRPGIKVYVCPGMSRQFKDKVSSSGGSLIECGGFTEIAGNVFIAQELPGIYKGKDMPEESLVVRTENGVSVITGCAHPGIVEILELVKRQFRPEEIYLAMGGFHLHNLSAQEIADVVSGFRRNNVAKVAPLHCTGKEAESALKAEYKENFIDAKTGLSVSL